MDGLSSVDHFFFFLPAFLSPSKSAHQTSFRLFLNFNLYVFLLFILVLDHFEKLFDLFNFIIELQFIMYYCF